MSLIKHNKNRVALRAASAAVEMLENRILLSAVTANFEGGNGTSSVDQYQGMAGLGWSAGWTPATGTGSLISAASVSLGTSTSSAINGGGRRLSATVTASGTSGGAGGVGRAYTTVGSGAGQLSTTAPHQLSFYYRLDGSAAAFDTTGDAVIIAGDNSTKLATASSNTWVAAAYGGTVGSLNAMTWAFQNGTKTGGAGSLVDTGILLAPGHVYQFTITLDPGQSRYRGTVRDMSTNVQFVSGLIGFRSSATSTSSINFSEVFGSTSDNGNFSVDAIDAAPQIAPPTTLTTSNTTATGTTLNWADASSNETGFVVQRSSDQVNWTTVASPAAGATSYPDSGLTAGTTYYYLVRAINSDANSTEAQVSAVTLPANVTTANVASVMPGAVSLTWAAAAGASSYRIDRQDGPTGTFASIGSSNTASYVDSTVAENIQYSYRVRSRNSAGTLAAGWSSTATATTPLLPATNVTVTPLSASQAQISWTDNSLAESNYRIERSTNNSNWSTVTASLAANVTSYMDSGLTEGTTYWYRVTPLPIINLTIGMSVSGITLPGTPSGLAAVIEASHKIHLTWLDNSSCEQSYRVERRIAGGTWGILNSALPVNIQTYLDMSAVANTSYEYRVFAVGSGGDSTASNIFSVNTNIPTAPSSLVAVNNGAAGIALNWTDNAVNETGYELQRRAGTGNFVTIIAFPLPANVVSAIDTETLSPGVQYDYRVLADGKWDNSNTSGIASIVTALAAPTVINLVPSDSSLRDTVVSWSPVPAATSYEIFRSESDADTSNPLLGALWQSIGTTSGTSFTDSAVAPGYSYLYKIRASNSVAQSGYSANKLLPGQPKNLAVTTLTDVAIRLTWTDVPAEGHYRIERAIGPTADYAALENGDLQGGVLAANTTSYVDSGLTPSTLYRYRIRAVSSDEVEVASAAAGGVSTTTLPGTPTNVVLTEINAGHVDIAWTGSPDSTQYEVDRRLEGGPWATIGTASASVYNDRAIYQGGSYSYRVRALTLGGPSASSAPSSITLENVAFPFTDDFSRPNQQQFGNNWNAEDAFTSSVVSGQVSLTESNYDTRRLLVAQVHMADVSVSVDIVNYNTVQPGPLNGWNFGLVARANQNSYYLGQIRLDSSGHKIADIIRVVDGGRTTLYSHSIPDYDTASTRLRFEVNGSTLGLYLGDKLFAGCTDNQLTGPGYVGMIASGGYDKVVDNFSAQPSVADAPHNAVLPFYDTFTRTTAGLGPDWIVKNGGINGMEHLASFGWYDSFAVLNGVALANTDIAADVSAIHGNGGTPGLVARYEGTTNSYYLGKMKPGFNSSMGYEIDKVINGVETPLAYWGSGPRADGRLDFSVVGPNLILSFNGVIIVSATDETLVNAGSVGIFGNSDATIDNFEAVDQDDRLTVPTAPSTLIAIPNGTSSVGLTWKDALGEAAYVLERDDGYGGAFSTVGTPARNTTQYTDTTVTPGLTYQYRLRSANAAGHSAWTANASVTVSTPGAPTDITVSHVTDNQTQLVVNWTAAITGGQNKYILQRRTEISGWSTIKELDKDTNYYVDSGLDPVTPYKYQVTAANGVGNSSTTTAESVVPSQPPVYPPPPATTPAYLATVGVGVKPGGNTASFGSNFPAGRYKISYISGSWTKQDSTGLVYGTDPWQWDTYIKNTFYSSTAGYSVISGTSQSVPGVGLHLNEIQTLTLIGGGQYIDTPEDIEKQSRGKSVTIDHPGGTMSIQFGSPSDAYSGSVLFGLEAVPLTFNLSAADVNDPSNSVATLDSTPADLYIPLQSNGTAVIDAIALVDGPVSGQSKVVWKIIGSNASITGGTFGGGDQHVTLSPQNDNASFILEAAEDQNGDGIMNESAQRTINIHIQTVQLDADSNNDGQFTSADDAIEEEVTKPGVISRVLPDAGTGGSVIKIVVPAASATSSSTINFNYDLLRATMFDDNGMTVAAYHDYSLSELGIVPGQVKYLNFRTTEASQTMGDYIVTVHLKRDNNTAVNAAASDTIRLTAVNVTFEKTYSDQFAGVNSNYTGTNPADSHTGVTKGYILMGTRADGDAYGRADIAITPDTPAIRNAINFGFLVTTTNDKSIWDWADPTVGDMQLTGNQLSINGSTELTLDDDTDFPGNAQTTEEVDSMQLVWGIDRNADGKVQDAEVRGIDSHSFHVVDKADYYDAIATLDGIRQSWSWSGLSSAANFLYCFLNDLPLAGATSTTVNLRPNAFAVNHNVGAVFNSNLDGSILRNEFSSSSVLSQEIADSQFLGDKILAIIDANKSSIESQLGSPSATASTQIQFSMPLLQSLDFGLADPDLKMAIGNLTLNNTAAGGRVGVDLSQPFSFTATAAYAYEDGSLQLKITNIKITGTGYDVYDFNYDDDYHGISFPFAAGATVQAGFGTLGTAGHLFESVIDLSTVRSTGFQFDA